MQIKCDKCGAKIEINSVEEFLKTDWGFRRFASDDTLTGVFCNSHVALKSIMTSNENRLKDFCDYLLSSRKKFTTPQPHKNWAEADGEVLWINFNNDEPNDYYIGTPLDEAFEDFGEFIEDENGNDVYAGKFMWWIPLPYVKPPAKIIDEEDYPY